MSRARKVNRDKASDLASVQSVPPRRVVHKSGEDVQAARPNYGIDACPAVDIIASVLLAHDRYVGKPKITRLVLMNKHSRRVPNPRFSGEKPPGGSSSTILSREHSVPRGKFLPPDLPCGFPGWRRHRGRRTGRRTQTGHRPSTETRSLGRCEGGFFQTPPHRHGELASCIV